MKGETERKKETHQEKLSSFFEVKCFLFLILIYKWLLQDNIHSNISIVKYMSILDQSRIKNLSDGLQDGIFLQKLFTGTGRQLFS